MAWQVLEYWLQTWLFFEGLTTSTLTIPLIARFIDDWEACYNIRKSKTYYNIMKPNETRKLLFFSYSNIFRHRILDRIETSPSFDCEKSSLYVCWSRFHDLGVVILDPLTFVVFHQELWRIIISENRKKSLSMRGH